MMGKKRLEHRNKESAQLRHFPVCFLEDLGDLLSL
jgi:hypothetical protein